jgi:uncharacterized protein (DUF1778 family)
MTRFGAVKGKKPSEKTKQIHIRLTEDEWKNLRVVTTHAGLAINDFVRPALCAHVEAEIDRRNLRPALPHRSQSAPTPSAQK